MILGSDEIIHVGTIASNGNRKIGLDIAEAMQCIGPDGIITVEEIKSLELELELVDGMRFDKCYASKYFLVNQEQVVCNLKQSYILVRDKSIKYKISLTCIGDCFRT